MALSGSVPDAPVSVGVAVQHVLRGNASEWRHRGRASDGPGQSVTRDRTSVPCCCQRRARRLVVPTSLNLFPEQTAGMQRPEYFALVSCSVWTCLDLVRGVFRRLARCYFERKACAQHIVGNNRHPSSCYYPHAHLLICLNTLIRWTSLGRCPPSPCFSS